MCSCLTAITLKFFEMEAFLCVLGMLCGEVLGPREDSTRPSSQVDDLVSCAAFLVFIFSGWHAT